MIEHIVIEWSYKPKNYFEYDFEIICDNCKISITPGIAKAKISPIGLLNVDEIIHKLTNELESRFLAIQFVNNQKYILGIPSRYDINKDGTKVLYLYNEITCVAEIGPLEVIIHDKNGNIVSDSKQERINKKKWFSETCIKYIDDQTLKQMLTSYKSSIHDPDNELVHLYEIRDAISQKFSGEHNARSKLNISKKEWSDFGLIANKKPLLQGRHRGINAGILRQAETSELDIARKIATKIVENYLLFLEKAK